MVFIHSGLSKRMPVGFLLEFKVGKNLRILALRGLDQLEAGDHFSVLKRFREHLVALNQSIWFELKSEDDSIRFMISLEFLDCSVVAVNLDVITARVYRNVVWVAEKIGILFRIINNQISRVPLQKDRTVRDFEVDAAHPEGI